MPGETPVPSSPTVCGLPEALSVIVRFAASVPDVVGENVTLIVQLFPEVRTLGQLLVSLYCELVSEMLVIESVALPELVNTMFCGVLLLPTVCEPNDRLALESVTAGTCKSTEIVLSCELVATRSGRPS